MGPPPVPTYPMNTGMGATYWDAAGNQHQVGGQPGFWSPNLLTPVGSLPAPVAPPAPTAHSLPPPWPPRQGDPDWEGPDPERVQEQQDRIRRTAQNFYRNNPEHFLSKLDSRLRGVFGMRQLDSPGQLAGKPTVDYTQQTQAQPQIDYGTAPFGTMDIPNAQGDLGLMDANRQVREANAARQAQAQENARIEREKQRNRQKAAAAARQAEARQSAERERQRAASSRSMGTRARGSRGRDSGGGGTSGPTGGMGGQGWT